MDRHKIRDMLRLSKVRIKLLGCSIDKRRRTSTPMTPCLYNSMSGLIVSFSVLGVGSTDEK